MAEKQLQCTVRAAAYQKAWFAQLRDDVFEKQKPYAIVQADMPLELFHAMDVPVVSNQWWAAVVAAKRLAPHYLDGLNALGYHDGLCRYCSLSLASTIAGDPAASAVGRTAEARAAFRPAYLRLHPARLRNLGGQAGRSVCPTGRSWRGRASSTLVGAEPLPLERTVRRPSAGLHGGAVSFAHREAGTDYRQSVRHRAIAQLDGRRQPAGTIFRRSARDDLQRAANAGPDARAGEQRDGGAVAARQRLGHRSRPRVSR